MNMALDEAMLQSAREPWLRVYRWAEPTVSIGFSQPATAVPEARRDWPLVRRWTGGGVVVHDGDWTYTLAVPASHPASRERAPEFYRRVHEALMAALAECGVGGCELQSSSAGDGMGVCFEEPARFDVVGRRGEKLAGAAQRRAAAGLLHQGSVQSLEIPGGLAARFAADLAGEIAVVTQDEAEALLMDAARDLAVGKYGTPSWLENRTAPSRAPGRGLERIFVYGTLKRGCRNASQLEGQRFLGEARTRPLYRLADLGGYPGMQPAACEGVSIRGEVWEVDSRCRARLDVLEDVAHGVYALEPVQLLPPFDSGLVRTYLYCLDTAGRPDAGEEWRGN